MSSNQPPTTNPIDDTNTLFTPEEPQRTTHIHVITQDSENATQQLDVSSTLSQDDARCFGACADNDTTEVSMRGMLFKHEHVHYKTIL